jgi:hypothetical protein
MAARSGLAARPGMAAGQRGRQEQLAEQAADGTGADDRAVPRYRDLHSWTFTRLIAADTSDLLVPVFP